MAVDLNTVAEDMFKIVEADHGSKKHKPGDLFKKMMDKYKDEDI